VADAARRAGGRVNVIPAGERWADGSLRPCLEDWLGAGAVISHLPGSRSPEADAASAVFERCRATLADAVRSCSTGRELEARGQANDLALASDLDASACAPRFDGVAFVSG
jgi:2-phosphosulfolactate phosphatase